jgi:dipeptidyl aminopeptidase/acylaminoacyl peptidase
MKRGPLDEALREAPIPVHPEAEQRGLEVVEAAYAQRQPQRRSTPVPRLALAFSVVTLLAALLLSPAGAAVREWVDDVVTISAPRPEMGLAEIPGGGKLLVQSAAGPWVVQPDGSRRLLGEYDEATWSPRGLFVATAAGRTLSALEPDGTPRWSLTAPRRVADPRWAPSGERIAYRAGTRLEVVAGDGTGERELAALTAPLAPAWSPVGVFQIAYVTSDRTLRIADSESGAILASAPALPGVTRLDWGGDVSSILEVSPRSLRLRAVQPLKLAGRPRLGPPRRLPVPPRARVLGAALSPSSDAVAAVLSRETATGRRSAVVIFSPDEGKARRLLGVPGELGEIAWSPDGRRLLVAWPDADQWLFLPAGRGKGRAVAGVSAAFSPGRQTRGFPRLEGWCCRR